MYQNKTLYRFIVAALSVVMTFTSTTGFALSLTGGGLASLKESRSEGLEEKVAAENFQATDPRLSDNEWVAYLWADKTHAPEYLKAFEDAPTADQIAEDFLAVYATSSNVGIAIQQYRYQSQKLLNDSYKYGPTLAQLLREEKYDEAFNYAYQKRLIRLIAQEVGLYALKLPEFTEDQMVRFFEAGGRHYDKVLGYFTYNPYKPRIWILHSNNMSNRAKQNINEYKEQGKKLYPNFTFYNSQTPPVEGPSALFKLAMGVIVGVMTAGIGSAIAGGIASTVGQGVTVAANGAITAGTIGGVSVASGTVGGTVLSVASNAVAGAVVATAQGQDFGDALKSGLVGGAVGSIAGAAANQVGTNGLASSLANNTPLNQTAANYVASTAIGTASNAILNGGDLDSAFQSAATSAAQSQLQGALTSASQNRQASADQLAQLDAWSARNNASIQGQLSGQVDTIVSNNIQSSGGLDFNTAVQSQNTWNNINNNYNNQMNSRVQSTANSQLASAQQISSFNQTLDSQIASNQAQMDARRVASVGSGNSSGSTNLLDGQNSVASSFGLEPSRPYDPFAGVQATIDSANQTLRNTIPGAGIVAGTFLNNVGNSLIPRNLASNPYSLFQGQIASGEYCTALTCRLLQDISGGRADLPNPSSFLYDRNGIAVVGQNGVANDFFYDNPNSSSLIDDFIRQNGEDFRFNFEVGDRNAILLNDAVYGNGRTLAGSFNNVSDVADFIAGTGSGDTFLAYINNPNGADHVVGAQNVNGRAVFAGNYTSAFLGGPRQAPLDQLIADIKIDPRTATVDLFDVNMREPSNLLDTNLGRLVTGVGSRALGGALTVVDIGNVADYFADNVESFLGNADALRNAALNTTGFESLGYTLMANQQQEFAGFGAIAGTITNSEVGSAVLDTVNSITDTVISGIINAPAIAGAAFEALIGAAQGKSLEQIQIDLYERNNSNNSNSSSSDGSPQD